MKLSVEIELNKYFIDDITKIVISYLPKELSREESDKLFREFQDLRFSILMREQTFNKWNFLTKSTSNLSI
jgi:hypothetical protein